MSFIRKTRLMLPAAALLCLLLLPSTLHAIEIKEGGMGGFSFGIHWLDLSGLNRELSRYGYGTFRENNYTYGGSGFGVLGERLILGGEGHGFTQEVSTAAYSQRLSGGYGFFDVGYIVLDRWNINVYPMVGLGGGGMGVRITERSAPTFSDILTDPKREAGLSTAGLMAQAGLGIHYLLNLAPYDNSMDEGGLFFGLRAGYTLPFSETEWEMGDIKISGGPSTGVKGFYLKFIFGGWGFSKREIN